MMSFFPIFFTISILFSFINPANTMEAAPHHPITTQPPRATPSSSDTPLSTVVTIDQPANKCSHNCYPGLCSRRTCMLTLSSVISAAAAGATIAGSASYGATPLLHGVAGLFTGAGGSAAYSAYLLAQIPPSKQVPCKEIGTVFGLGFLPSVITSIAVAASSYTGSALTTPLWSGACGLLGATTIITCKDAVIPWCKDCCYRPDTN